MTFRRGIPDAWVLLLLAAGSVPLYAQFTTTGCPAGPQGPHLNGFTAGTTSSSQICLTGSFSVTGSYNVGLFSSLRNVTINGVSPQSNSLIEVTVPASFYATVGNPNQADPVTVDLTGPGGNQNSTFQVNPPLRAGGPVFASGVNTAVSWTMYTGGTPPYENEFSNGQVPTGMSSFPLSGQTWTGTPNETGAYQFIMVPTDAWGNEITATLTAYIVPNPQLTGINPTTALAGAGNTTLTLTGSGFISPATIGSTPEPGSLVTVVPGVLADVMLTPTSYSPTQLTVTLPSGLLATTGYLTVQVVNPGTSPSVPAVFTVSPSITGLSTNSRTAGASAFALGVTGTGYISGSVVRMNGSPLPTTFLSTTNLTATFPTDTTLGPVFLSVLNPDTTVSPAVTAAVLNIVAAPTLSGLSPTSVNAGGPSFALTVTGSHFLSGMTVYFDYSPVPTTLILNNNQANSQLVANIPAAAIAAGNIVPVWVATSDGYTTPALYFTIVSTTPPLQLLTLSPLPAGMINTAYSTTFTATGGAGGYTYSVTGGTLPAGLQLSSNGVLSGTPTASGASNFAVQVTDASGTSVGHSFALNIAPRPLTLTTGPLANTLQNAPVSIQFAGSGGVPPYSFVEFGALPPGTQMSSAGLLSGTPTKAGSYPFLVFLNDSAGASTSKSYTLNAAVPGLLITSASPLPAGQVNVPYTTQMSATGGIGAPYTWYASGLPQGLTMASNTGLVAGIPRVAGTFTVGVTVGDLSGATVTQNYTLAIASLSLTFTTGSLPNGAVGSSYSANLSASGGSGTYTFTATGLPPCLTLTSSTLSGTPTTAGTFTMAVTVTDTQGLSATASFKVTIAAQLVVTGVTISNAVLGTAITSVKLAATGGTPPYQWQSANPAPGLSLALDGTLSGTPTAAGTFSFGVYAVDSNGALSSGTVQVIVGLPAAPAVTISGLPATNAPATQPRLQVALASPYAVTITANLTLTFVPDSGAGDPSIQFDTGGRTAQIVIPAGDTGGLTDVGVQTGTVAGAITITVQLLAGSQNVTPTPAPSRAIRVNAGAPVITGMTAARTGTGFAVVVTGYASNRDVDSGAYQFSGSAGANLLTSQLATAVTSLFTAWYGSASAAPYGSQFSLTQSFTVSGSASAVLAVTLTLTNGLGTSPAASANLQ